MKDMEEDIPLVRNDPDLKVAFDAQDTLMPIMKTWASKMEGMSKLSKKRHWWAVMDFVMCAMYRTIPASTADTIIRSIREEIRAGRG